MSHTPGIPHARPGAKKGTALFEVSTVGGHCQAQVGNNSVDEQKIAVYFLRKQGRIFAIDMADNYPKPVPGLKIGSFGQADSYPPLVFFLMDRLGKNSRVG